MRRCEDISDNKGPHATPGLAQCDNAADTECSKGQRRDVSLGKALGHHVEEPIILLIKEDSEVFVGHPGKGLPPRSAAKSCCGERARLSRLETTTSGARGA